MKLITVGLPLFLFAFALNGRANSDCSKLYSAFKEIRETTRIYSGRLLRDVDPALYKILEKTRVNPERTLSIEETRWLKSNQAEGLYEQWKNTTQWVLSINKELADLHRAKVRASDEKQIIKILKWTGKALFPMYRLLPRGGSVRQIARAIVADPNYVFTENEAKYLSKKGLLRDMERFRADVKNGLGEKFAKISQLKTIGKSAAWTVAISGVAMGLGGNKYITAKNSFDENNADGMSKYDDKVELIFLSPMPHAAIRVGGVVYNYGVLNIQRLTLDAFKKTTGFGNALSGNHTRIELHLTDDEKEKLRAYLEQDVGRVYPLVFPFVDCVSQTNKAVKFTTGMSPPSIISRSQSLSIAYYKLRKFLGDERIGDIRYATQHSTASDKTVDAAINGLDGLFFMQYAGQLLMSTPILDQFKLTMDPITHEAD